jgi:hypothetical protein
MIFISMIAVDVDGSENEILSTSCVLPSASACCGTAGSFAGIDGIVVCTMIYDDVVLFSASLPDGLFGALVLEDATSLLFPPK